MFDFYDIIVWQGITIRAIWVKKHFPEDLPDCRLATEKEEEAYHARK